MSRILTDTEALHRLSIGETLYVGIWAYTRSSRYMTCGCCDDSDDFEDIDEAMDSLRKCTDNFTQSFINLKEDNE